MREVGEVRFRFEGPQELCAPYIPVARNILGMMRVTHKVDTASRTVTLPDGTIINVEFGAGPPIITIAPVVSAEPVPEVSLPRIFGLSAQTQDDSPGQLTQAYARRWQTVDNQVDLSPWRLSQTYNGPHWDGRGVLSEWEPETGEPNKFILSDARDCMACISNFLGVDSTTLNTEEVATMRDRLFVGDKTTTDNNVWYMESNGLTFAMQHYMPEAAGFYDDRVTTNIEVWRVPAGARLPLSTEQQTILEQVYGYHPFIGTIAVETPDTNTGTISVLEIMDISLQGNKILVGAYIEDFLEPAGRPLKNLTGIMEVVFEATETLTSPDITYTSDWVYIETFGIFDEPDETAKAIWAVFDSDLDSDHPLLPQFIRDNINPNNRGDYVGSQTTLPMNAIINDEDWRDQEYDAEADYWTFGDTSYTEYASGRALRSADYVLTWDPADKEVFALRYNTSRGEYGEFAVYLVHGCYYDEADTIRYMKSAFYQEEWTDTTTLSLEGVPPAVGDGTITYDFTVGDGFLNGDDTIASDTIAGEMHLRMDADFYTEANSVGIVFSEVADLRYKGSVSTTGSSYAIRQLNSVDFANYVGPDSNKSVPATVLAPDVPVPDGRVFGSVIDNQIVIDSDFIWAPVAATTVNELIPDFVPDTSLQPAAVQAPIMSDRTALYAARQDPATLVISGNPALGVRAHVIPSWGWSGDQIYYAFWGQTKNDYGGFTTFMGAGKSAVIESYGTDDYTTTRLDITKILTPWGVYGENYFVGEGSDPGWNFGPSTIAVKDRPVKMACNIRARLLAVHYPKPVCWFGDWPLEWGQTEELADAIFTSVETGVDLLPYYVVDYLNGGDYFAYTP